MGVHGLWELLSPVGHRVSNDHVRNKILAVDVSIWLTQFVKAMRDTEGAQIRNSHLLGVFRRCVKLLYLSVKPVLIFDGATPALKRRTLSSRRAQREKHAAKLRRLAEKMLLNHVKRRTIAHVITKQRTEKRQKTTTASKKSPVQLKEVTHTSHDLKTQCPSPETMTGHEGERVPLSDNSGMETKAMRASTNTENPRGLKHHVSLSEWSSEENDADEAPIFLPRNVDDLDDEALTRLPANVQAEVFKQVKIDQRARHRENMMLKRQDPSEFSRMQIEGFLQHTALNRKISRVRSVINSKSGASQRIASDSERKFILEEDACLGTCQGIEANESEDDFPRTGFAAVGSASVVKSDLLADIRAKKEATQNATESTATRNPNTLRQERHLESGTGWASKVLEGHGGLVLRPSLLGSAGDEITGEHQSSSHADDDSDVCVEEQCLLSSKNISNARGNRITQGKENCVVEEQSIVDDSNSDDDEWEDGDQSVQRGCSRITDKGVGRSDMETSTFEKVFIGESHPDRLFESLSAEEISQQGEPDRGEPANCKHLEWKVTENAEAEVKEKMTGESELVVMNCISRDADRHHMDTTLHASSSSPRRSENPSPMRRERRSSEEHHKDEVKYDLEVAGKGVRSVNTHPSHVHADAGVAISDSTQVGGQGEARTNPTEGRSVKHVSFVDSADLMDLVQSTEPRKTSMVQNQEEGAEDLSAIPTRKRSAPRYGMTEPLSRNRVSMLEPKNNSYLEGNRCNSTAAGDSITPQTADEDSYNIECAEPYVASGHETSLSQLESLQQDLDTEAREIQRQRLSHRGGVDSVADEMYAETRDLAKLFGIPYLEAPMEAEAQCAFLNEEKMVDGVLTEDSDAFLFGARTVYRHLFAEGRFAEAYDADDIQLSLGLDRENLIRLAYLLGSDYTVGVRGVGVVNSMEILESFPGQAGLEEFREWTKSVTVLDQEPEEEVMRGQTREAVRRRFCWKHRNMKRNWEVREGFPNPTVFEAYINPVVDKSKETFKWDLINFEGLEKFCWDKFGWEKDRFDTTVGPLRQMLGEKSGMTQTRIDEYFKPHRFAKIRSERLQKAVHGMAGNVSKELMAPPDPGVGKRNINPVTHFAELGDDEEHADAANRTGSSGPDSTGHGLSQSN